MLVFRQTRLLTGEPASRAAVLANGTSQSADAPRVDQVRASSDEFPVSRDIRRDNVRPAIDRLNDRQRKALVEGCNDDEAR
ncbi:unannotated protein [freshwater metagenome]|uniref:Unannotated protein n=1 Tax=freshwater metagenome TaxID=449393 RepID=A0A6J7M5P8_9ZZZZ